MEFIHSRNYIMHIYDNMNTILLWSLFCPTFISCTYTTTWTQYYYGVYSVPLLYHAHKRQHEHNIIMEFIQSRYYIMHINDNMNTISLLWSLFSPAIISCTYTTIWTQYYYGVYSVPLLYHAHKRQHEHNIIMEFIQSRYYIMHMNDNMNTILLWSLFSPAIISCTYTTQKIMEFIQSRYYIMHINDNMNTILLWSLFSPAIISCTYTTTWTQYYYGVYSVPLLYHAYKRQHKHNIIMEFIQSRYYIMHIYDNMNTILLWSLFSPAIISCL
jgi:hypothetical protein